MKNLETLKVGTQASFYIASLHGDVQGHWKFLEIASNFRARKIQVNYFIYYF